MGAGYRPRSTIATLDVVGRQLQHPGGRPDLTGLALAQAVRDGTSWERLVAGVLHNYDSPEHPPRLLGLERRMVETEPRG